MFFYYDTTHKVKSILLKFFDQHISNWKEKEDTKRRSIQLFTHTDGKRKLIPNRWAEREAKLSKFVYDIYSNSLFCIIELQVYMISL